MFSVELKLIFKVSGKCFSRNEKEAFTVANANE